MEKTVSNSISSSKHDFSYTCSVCKGTFSSVHFCMGPRKFVDLLNKKTKQTVTSDLSREERIKQIEDSREVRDVIFLGYYPEHGKSYDKIQCAFCDEVLKMYRWSGQKTCKKCGAVSTKFGLCTKDKTLPN